MGAGSSARKHKKAPISVRLAEALGPEDEKNDEEDEIYGHKVASPRIPSKQSAHKVSPRDEAAAAANASRHGSKRSTKVSNAGDAPAPRLSAAGPAAAVHGRTSETLQNSGKQLVADSSQKARGDAVVRRSTLKTHPSATVGEAYDRNIDHMCGFQWGDRVIGAGTGGLEMGVGVVKGPGKVQGFVQVKMDASGIEYTLKADKLKLLGSSSQEKVAQKVTTRVPLRSNDRRRTVQ
mmetsp:Transcript_39054/g.110348  ORF Transcript_39054/g.110348 Transcript_39054/m.110348 type:complete len:235 (+) Transcript_39054:61-765(+)|eukprot:CAMPEP_0179281538 /NCGR_PEP_ID=MMETSP0797-20121207/37205_1 /TAXON_ID=47934 /ORGANISM="Dinophysis acuminata, Strain DAEP01" /LENGTH=234 /DNA_ID=CAMNT_0020990249 /DNA_START=53 /DNA_END=757 /DNA_ORIENTATION=+